MAGFHLDDVLNTLRFVYTSEGANQLIRDPPCDSCETCQESKGRGLLQLVKRENFCAGVVCCLGRAASQSPHC